MSVVRRQGLEPRTRGLRARTRWCRRGLAYAGGCRFRRSAPDGRVVACRLVLATCAATEHRSSTASDGRCSTGGRGGGVVMASKQRTFDPRVSLVPTAPLCRLVACASFKAAGAPAAPRCAGRRRRAPVAARQRSPLTYSHADERKFSPRVRRPGSVLLLRPSQTAGTTDAIRAKCCQEVAITAGTRANPTPDGELPRPSALSRRARSFG